MLQSTLDSLSVGFEWSVALLLTTEEDTKKIIHERRSGPALATGDYYKITGPDASKMMVQIIIANTRKKRRRAHIQRSADRLAKFGHVGLFQRSARFYWKWNPSEGCLEIVGKPSRLFGNLGIKPSIPDPHS